MVTKIMSWFDSGPSTRPARYPVRYNSSVDATSWCGRRGLLVAWVHASCEQLLDLCCQGAGALCGHRRQVHGGPAADGRRRDAPRVDD